MAKVSQDTASEFRVLEKSILAGNIAPVYLLFGKEHYYIDKLCSLLMDKVIPEGERDFGNIVFYGADVNAEQVVSTARQYPMMVSRQLVVVKEAQMMKDLEKTAVYFEGIMPTTVLVICYKTVNDPTKSGKNIDKRSSFYKQAQKYGAVFESNQVPDYKMPRVIEGFVAEHGLSINPEAASLFAEFAGVDLQKIDLELGKLLKILPEGTKTITPDDIERNVGMSREYSVFELTRALSLKDSAKCFRIVRFYASSSKRYPFVVIMSAIAGHFMKLLRFESLLAEGKSRSEVLSMMGINPYFGGEYETAARNYPVKKLIRIISILTEYDLRSKGVAKGSVEDGDLLVELVSKILA